MFWPKEDLRFNGIKKKIYLSQNLSGSVIMTLPFNTLIPHILCNLNVLFKGSHKVDCLKMNENRDDEWGMKHDE